MEKEFLENCLKDKMTLKQMSDISDKAITTIRYWMKNHGLKAINSSGRTWTDEEMCEAIGSSFTVSNVLKKIGLKVSRGNYTTFYKYVKNNNIDVSHMTGKSQKVVSRKAKPLDEVMIEGSNYSPGNLKKRLLENGMLKNECYICRLSEFWNGKRIVLVMDHISGVNDDNRLSNLRMLCPNCNSQQKTFRNGFRPT